MTDRSPPITWAGVTEGARRTIPLLPGVAAFAAAFGTVAAQKGISVVEAMAMSLVVFAGASQMVALELWREPIEPALALAICGVVGAVNLRLVLMGATLRPWLGPVPSSRIYPSLFFLTDASWLVSLRYHTEGGRDWGVFVGCGLALWSTWIAATLPGVLFASLVPDPRAFALDMVMPAFFVTMLVPLWRGPRRAMPWAAAGIVSLATAEMVPGYWYIVAGAVAGSLTGAVFPAPEPPPETGAAPEPRR
jgi:predicted branched-subunit amino acid permease